MQIIWTRLFFLKGSVMPITFSRNRNLLFCHASGNRGECFAVTKQRKPNAITVIPNCTPYQRDA